MQRFPGAPLELPATATRRLRRALDLVDALRAECSAAPEGDLHQLRDVLREVRAEVEGMQVAEGASRLAALREAEGIVAGLDRPTQPDAGSRLVHVRGKLLAVLSSQPAHAGRPGGGSG